MRFPHRATAVLLLSIVISGLSGCAGVPMADPAQDAQAKRFIPPDNMAGIYLYREGTYAANTVIPVGIDGQFMGRTAVDSYFYWKLAPGQHIIVTGGYKPKTYKMEFEAGKNYFFKQSILVDQTFGTNVIIYRTYSKLIKVNEEQGKNDVLKCDLAASSQPKPVTATQQSNGPKLEELRGLLQPEQQ